MVGITIENINELKDSLIDLENKIDLILDYVKIINRTVIKLNRHINQINAKLHGG